MSHSFLALTLPWLETVLAGVFFVAANSLRMS
jgi:hypothetical protein